MVASHSDWSWPWALRKRIRLNASHAVSRKLISGVRSADRRTLTARLAGREAGSRHGPAQQIVELLILRRAQELLPLRGVREISCDQSAVRVAQSIGESNPRVSLTGDLFRLGHELSCGVLVPTIPVGSGTPDKSIITTDGRGPSKYIS